MSKCGVTFALCGVSIAALAQAPLPADKRPANAKTVEATVGTPTKHQTQAADDAYLAGARSLERNDLTNAEIQFDKAVKLDPFNKDYAMAYSITHQRHVTELVKESGKARLLGQNVKAETLLAEARLLDPQNDIVGQSGAPGALPKLFHPKIEPWIREGPAIAGPVTLTPNPGLKSFHLRSDEQDVIRQVLSGYGVRASFDESVQRQNIRFDLDDSPYNQAVPILLDMTHLFAVPLDAKSVLIAKDTPENRQRFERQLQETIYIPGMTNEQMDELGNVVRNVFDVKQLTVDKSAGTLVLRAPQETLTYVNLTLADLIDGGSEVMIDLKLYAVDKTNQRNIGAQLPQQIGLYNVSTEAANLVNANQSIVNQAIAQGLIPAGSSNITIALALIASGLVQSALLSNTVGFFGGGIVQTGVTINQNFTYNLALNASDTRALNDIQLRVGDRQPATFRIGERYPITTATYSTASPAQSSALAGVSINGVSAASLLNAAVGSPITIPQIQYEDLGLVFEATPRILRSGDVALSVNMKIVSLGATSINGIPVLNNIAYTGTAVLSAGDAAVLVSEIDSSEVRAISGLPGLSEVPGLDNATDKDTQKSEASLLIVMTPRVVRFPYGRGSSPMQILDHTAQVH